MSVSRILDANGNRAREALRVMEDAARFVLDDVDLAADLKQARHDLAEACHVLAGAAVARDVSGDIGRTISTESERTRASVADVVRAAGKRLGEALRSLEEFGKIEHPDFAGRIEALRYRGYDLERRLLQALDGAAPQWRLCVLLTESVCGGRPWESVARAVAGARPDCIQLREKGLDDAALLARARALVAMAEPETAVVVNDRVDVALAAGAHGVHVGQGDLPCAEVRRLAGPKLLVGVSTSTLDEAKQARRDGADYCGVGPMFASSTKAKPYVRGPEAITAYRAWDGLPHLAIGGITLENVARVVAAGARGVAVSSAVCAADDPAAAVRAFASAMERASDVERVSSA